MKHVDAFVHTRGESLYIDDIPAPDGTLHAAPVPSPIAHGKMTTLNVSAALKRPGVFAVLTAKDIPGENQIGGIVPDEPLFAVDEVHYMGQPVALILAEDDHTARKAVGDVIMEFDSLPIITDPREAFAQNQLITPPTVFSDGNIDAAWGECDLILEGVTESGGQEHLYLEPQSALAIPHERDAIRVYSSTQGPTNVQQTIAKVLGLPMHLIEVETQRLGGGFGGKEDQATAWGVMAALGAKVTGRSVKLILHRIEDMRMTGKRHPYSADYKIGVKKDGTIVAFEVTYFQNAGAAADLSPAVLGRTMLHVTSAYFIPNIKATGLSCKTNLPPNTAFRGFGGPQGMFVIEAAITRVAAELDCPPYEIQKRNLFQEGQHFYYGMDVKDCKMQECWDLMEQRYDLKSVAEEIERYNQQHFDSKRGMAIMPVCFGISFVKTNMNQASSLVNIYHDGSVGISTAAIEMGQGVTTKLVGVASTCLGISPSKIRIEPTATRTVINTSPSAASSEPDLNGKATELACIELRQTLVGLAADMLSASEGEVLSIENGIVIKDGSPSSLKWEKLVGEAFQKRLHLASLKHYATPDIHWDFSGHGKPFAYHAYGAAMVEVSVDCLRGTSSIDAVKIVHDAGESMNLDIDIGQTEGGVVQGIGWMTLEEVLYNSDGRLLTDTFSTYKIPDIYQAPKDIQIYFLENSSNPPGIFNSKAIGEPPLMYGLAAYFALENAISAFRQQREKSATKNSGVGPPDKAIAVQSPMTHERTLMALYQ